MQQQITRGDYLKDLITIYIDNNLQQSLTDLYSMFVFQCGEIQKQLTPASVIKISFTEAESKLLTNYNTCYLAGITQDGHKETFNGSISFNTRGEVVYYEPTPNGSLQATTTSVNDCPCRGITGVFANCTQPAIKAYFSINYVPTKLSELENDTDFLDSVDVASSIATHNASEEAHPYIRSVLTSTTEALAVSIQAETTARIDAVSLAISTTEAYTDTVVSVATEATKAYADSIVSTATTATEAYTDSVVQSATTAINTTIGDLSQLDTSVKSSVTNAINAEVSARQGADNNLQGQIDALAAASDVTDIVGTYAELQAYDTQHLNNNDIIKVLSDETHDDEPSYYRFNKTAGTFSYIGSESAAYTKAQSDSIFVTQTTTVNNKPLSSDITLTYSDVNALSDTYATTIANNTSAIASNSSTLAQHTTAIATNTSDISTINGKIPTDASSSNKLVSAASLAASIANFANKDLSNLTSNGNARLHALKAYADEGELLTDSDGLAFIKNYAHSTFDRTKFTVVGTPNITSGGIASGFSDNNYINVQLPTINTPATTNTILEIYGSFKVNSLPSGRSYIQGATIVNATQPALAVNSNGELIFSLYGEIEITTAPIDLNVNIDYKFILDETRYWKAYYKYVTQDSWTYVGQLAFGQAQATILTGSVYLGRSYSNDRSFSTGSIDLKQFSITVDGVEVFSGNRTGIDTIKPDDYTVVGTPAISADGIASGFSSGNYLQKTNLPDLSQYNSWKIQGKFRQTTSLPIDIRRIFGYSGDNEQPSCLAQIYDNKLNFACYDANSNTIFASGAGRYDVDLNKDYWFELEFTGSAYIGKISTDGITYNTFANVSSTTKVSPKTACYIGAGFQTYFDIGSIDLNAFKVYVDGNLVYQPCLKIPYTESKTGSKIVDSIYRDRVADMSAQFGFANYYTLDEDNSNFTLPQVELYGLIGQRTLRDSYRNGINYWELYSNRDLEQGGSCTSGVEVTFARPFADTNYVLSVPYSAKSATAFTPTASGDFIAKGLGVL